MFQWLRFHRPTSEDTQVVERRAFPRRQLSPNSSCRIITTMGQGSRPATIQDVSRGGVGITLDRPVEPGKQIIVNLLNAPRHFSKLVTVCVAHCTEQDENNYLVGAEFAEPLTAQELEALLA